MDICTPLLPSTSSVMCRSAAYAGEHVGVVAGQVLFGRQEIDHFADG